MATDPGTRSPGKLFIKYNDRGLVHTCSVALVADTDIQGVTDLRADATSFAGALATCLPSNRTITGWGLRLSDGGPSYEEAFADAIPGSHATDSGYPDYYSATVSVMGRSAGTGVGAARGSSRIVMFTGNAYPMPPAGQILIGTVPAAISSLVAILAASTRMWADFYGQKVDFTGRLTLQFNAAIQKSKGL